MILWHRFDCKVALLSQIDNNTTKLSLLYISVSLPSQTICWCDKFPLGLFTRPRTHHCLTDNTEYWGYNYSTITLNINYKTILFQLVLLITVGCRFIPNSNVCNVESKSFDLSSTNSHKSLPNVLVDSIVMVQKFENLTPKWFSGKLRNLVLTRNLLIFPDFQENIWVTTIK